MKKLVLILLLLLGAIGSHAKVNEPQSSDVDKQVQNIEVKVVKGSMWFINKTQVDIITCDSINKCTVNRSVVMPVDVITHPCDTALNNWKLAKEAYLNGVSEPYNQTSLKWEFDKSWLGLSHNIATDREILAYDKTNKTMLPKVLHEDVKKFSFSLVWLILSFILTLRVAIGIIARYNDDTDEDTVLWYFIISVLVIFVCYFATAISHAERSNHWLDTFPAIFNYMFYPVIAIVCFLIIFNIKRIRGENYLVSKILLTTPFLGILACIYILVGITIALWWTGIITAIMLFAYRKKIFWYLFYKFRKQPKIA